MKFVLVNEAAQLILIVVVVGARLMNLVGFLKTVGGEDAAIQSLLRYDFALLIKYIG